MIPAALFWAMVLAGSFHSLIAFGGQALGWHHGWDYLVPGSLDGVSVTFAFLAFRAVRKHKVPDRCNRVVWGAAIASAVVNFAYEYTHSGHNLVAGGYLALLSLFGMVMFHEFLDQFEDGAAYVKRDSPRFGLRWVTWPTNTFCAAVAWRNHPPADSTPATVLAAIANLNRVRVLKREAREAAVLARHQRAVTRAQRRAELTTANGGAPRTSDIELVPIAHADRETAAVVSAAITEPDDLRVVGPHHAAQCAAAEPAGAGHRAEPAPTEAKVPATAATLSQWVGTWMKICADGDLILGPLNDDTRARARYQLSAKQLRNIRNAATSGALRRRAAELDVPLPAGYIDRPATNRTNGHPVAAATGLHPGRG